MTRLQNMGPRLLRVLKIAWPLIIANSFWNLQLTIDRVFLGQFSTEALGAAMAVNGVFWVPMALLQGTAAYVTTFVAQYYGAKEHHMIGPALWQSFHVSWIGGLLFLGLSLISPAFFNWVGHAENVRALEIEYFNSLAWSALPTALVAAISGFFTGLGNTRIVIAINFTGLVLNAVLDYLLIFGNWGFPALGVAGAGYATALATFGAAAMGLFLLLRPSLIRTYKLLTDWHIRGDLMRPYLKFGLPSGLQWALEGLAFTVFLMAMGHYPQGDAALAASSIAVTIMLLSVLPAMGVAQAVLTLVGQHIGEGKPEEAARTTVDGIILSAMYMAVVAASFFTIPEFYLSWFTNEQNPELWAQTAAIGIPLLKIVALFTAFDSLYLNISFALKGAGDTRFVSLVALTVPWPFMVLPAFLVKDWENPVIWAWVFAAVYVVITAGILFLRFRQGKWKSMSVIHSSP